METKKQIKDLEKKLGISEFKPIKPLWERKMFRDKQGNKLTFKEFVSRWKGGIEGITPLQQTNVQLKSTFIMLVGIVAGFIFSLFNLRFFWWGSIILGGAFGNTIIQYIGLKQKKNQLSKFENLEEMSLEDALKDG